jgi:hypothetical protein
VHDREHIVLLAGEPGERLESIRSVDAIGARHRLPHVPLGVTGLHVGGALAEPLRGIRADRLEQPKARRRRVAVAQTPR